MRTKATLPVTATQSSPVAIGLRDLDAIRTVVGEAVRENSLYEHVQNNSQLHWAVNSFFRAHFESGLTADDLLTHCPAHSTECRRIVPTAEYSANQWLEDLDDALLLQVFLFLAPAQLVQVIGTSRRANELASDNMVWRNICVRRTGLTVKEVNNEVMSAAEPGQPGLWRSAFLAFQALLKSRPCVACGQTRGMVPIVYGFPAQCLMKAVRDGQLAMGWDYKNEGDANWECVRCKYQSHCFPWDRSVRLKMIAHSFELAYLRHSNA